MSNSDNLLISEYISYDGKTLNDIFVKPALSDYLVSNFKPFSCFLTAIIDTYPKIDLRRNKHEETQPMNYENLNMFLTGSTLKPKNPISIDTAMKFFDRYKLHFTAIAME